MTNKDGRVNSPRRPGRIPGWRRALLAGAALLIAGGCSDEIPTSEDGNLIPIDAQTVQVFLDWEEFGRDFRTFGGFSTPAALSTLHIAREYRGDLDAAALLRFAGLPGSVLVRPPGSPTTQADTAYVPVGGTMVVRMDTTRFRPEVPIELTASRIISRWDERTAGWAMAVDTFGDALAWPVPGAGESVPFSTVTWDPEVADSVVFEVDSVTANAWRRGDVEERGARISVNTPGARLEATTAIFRADVRSQVNPDTLIPLAANPLNQTTIYAPEVGVSPDEFRIGGAPARRATLRLALPSRIEEGNPVCAAVACPLELRPERIVYAGLVMTTAPTTPAGLAPVDTLRMDVRPALAPDRLPKSPLGPSVQPSIRRIPATAFLGDAGVTVEVPMTRYFRDLLGGVEPEPGEGTGVGESSAVPSTLTFLSPSEPVSLGFGSFVGPGSAGEPFLRLILTLSDGVSLP